MYADKVAATYSTWQRTINATAAADFVSAHTSIARQ